MVTSFLVSAPSTTLVVSVTVVVVSVTFGVAFFGAALEVAL